MPRRSESVDCTGIQSKYDIQTSTLGYSYFLVLKEHLGFGVNVGIRVLDIEVDLSLADRNGDHEGEIGTEGADVTGPLPFIGGELRYMLAENWRLVSHLGWLDATVGDISASQWILAARVEHLSADHFSWGLEAGVSTIDAEVDDADYLGAADIDLDRVGIFICWHLR